MKRRIFVWIIAILTATACIGCGTTQATPPPLASVTATLGVQNDVTVLGECNAFVVTVDGEEAVSATYTVTTPTAAVTLTQVAEDGVLVYAYRCTELGAYRVKAEVVTAQGKRITTQERPFTVVGGGGDTFGPSPLGEFPSVNMDLSGDKGDSPQLVHKSVRNYTEEYAYFKSAYGSRFVAQVTVDIVSNNYDDPYPKSGIFVKSGNTRYYYAFDFRPDFSFRDVIFVRCDVATWHWPGTVWQVDAPFRNGNDRRTNTMTLVRDGELFYFAINGNWIGKQTEQGFTDDTTVGTLTISHHTVFTEYSCYMDGTPAFKQALSAAQTYFGS